MAPTTTKTPTQTKALLAATAGRIARRRAHITALCAADPTPALLPDVRNELEQIDREYTAADKMLDDRTPSNG